MNIVFMGSPDFAIPSLNKIHQSHHILKAVVTNVDKRRGRGNEKAPTPVKARAKELGLPVIEVEDLKSTEFEEELKKLDADLFVVVAFRVLPKSILSLPKTGSINLHASLLPKYRGAAPIHWAVINGEEETGCTIFFLDEKVDTGNIILQKKIQIGSEETAGEVYERLMLEGSEALLEAINKIEEDDYTLQPQNHEETTAAPKLFKENTRIDFTKTTKEVVNLVRGLNPFPTAWAEWQGKKMNIYKVQMGPLANIDPGELFRKNDKVLVGCCDGTVELQEVQLPGRKRMTGQELANGYEITGLLH